MLQLGQILGHQDADDVFAPWNTGKREEWPASITERSSAWGVSSMSIVHARDATMTSPAVMSAMRITRSIITRANQRRLPGCLRLPPGTDEFFRRVGAGVNELGPFAKAAHSLFSGKRPGCGLDTVVDCRTLQLWWTGPGIADCLDKTTPGNAPLQYRAGLCRLASLLCRLVHARAAHAAAHFLHAGPVVPEPLGLLDPVVHLGERCPPFRRSCGCRSWLGNLQVRL